MACDLHIHTSSSDGKLSPFEIIQHAKEVKLDTIAITDHDTIEGLIILQKTGLFPNKDIRIIPGIEFSAHMPKHEVHILGLNINIFYQPLIEKMQEVVEERWLRFERMVEKIQKLGYDLSKADVLTIAGDTQSIGRAHIARALVEKGLFANVGAVFEKLLYKGKPAYEHHYKLETSEIVELIHAAGGKAILAHPGLVGDDDIVMQILAQDIDGLEVYHPRHDEVETRKYRQLAEERNLMITGGSDFHAIPTRYPEVLGIFTIDNAYAEQFDENSGGI